VFVRIFGVITEFCYSCYPQAGFPRVLQVVGAAKHYLKAFHYALVSGQGIEQAHEVGVQAISSHRQTAQQVQCTCCHSDVKLITCNCLFGLLQVKALLQQCYSSARMQENHRDAMEKLEKEKRKIAKTKARKAAAASESPESAQQSKQSKPPSKKKTRKGTGDCLVM
jgi:hypothetical protein